MPTFPATSAVSGGGQITLAQIEREVSRRVGPHYFGPNGWGLSISSLHSGIININRFKSTTGDDSPEDMFILRRGLSSDGVTAITVTADDRQRRIATIDPTSGATTPDRPWATAPNPDVGSFHGEAVEVHYLDPAEELRPAVLAGLRRCFFEDRVAITLTGAAAERDITAQVFWITDPSQIRRIQWTATGATLTPEDVGWTDPFLQGGHVWLAAQNDPFPNTLLITARRAHATFVNGADSTTGPTADTDLLSLDLDYAAAAGHIECWRINPSRMAAAAAGGMQATQAHAANEFTRLARIHNRRSRPDWALTAPFGPGLTYSRVVR